MRRLSSLIKGGQREGPMAPKVLINGDDYKAHACW